MASGGAILLDEIADLPLALQPKLLRVLQERELERIGGNRTVKIDVRIICSTAKDLDAEVDKGTFRRDLLYRLRVIPIVVPPLRERREDIPRLVAHFLHGFSLKRGVAMSLTPEAMALLVAYDYPGNIRELRNIIERASVLAPEAIIGVGDLPADLGGQDETVASDSPLLADVVARAEKQAIARALTQTGGGKSLAAGILGISRKNLWEKMKQYEMG
jgi:two-component system response regulator AtoC